MNVEVATAASEELRQIRSWNVSAYGAEHANRYVDLIRQEIGALGLASSKDAGGGSVESLLHAGSTTPQTARACDCISNPPSDNFRFTHLPHGSRLAE